MGLTVQCAKCHTHKYDPIPQTDYYRMQAIFMTRLSARRSGCRRCSGSLHEATAVQEKEAKEHNAKVDAEIAEVRKEWAKLKTKEKEPTASSPRTIKTLTAKKRTFPEIRAFYDLPGEAKTHLLKRGDYLHPGPEVTPGVLRRSRQQAFDLPQRAKDAKTSGRRLAFAAG